MKKLVLQSREGFPYLSKFGTEHREAVIVVSTINNNIIKKTLSLDFLVFNDSNSLEKQELDFAFNLHFDNQDVEETIVNQETGEVIWGKPSYDQVVSLFEIQNDGIYIKDDKTEMWFLNKVEFENKKLIEEWEIL